MRGQDVLFTRSLDGGLTFEAPQTLVTSAFSPRPPVSIVARGEDIFVAAVAAIDTVNLYRNTAQGTGGFALASAQTDLTDIAEVLTLQYQASNGTLWLVGAGNGIPTALSSTDDGTTFTRIQPTSTSPAPQTNCGTVTIGDDALFLMCGAPIAIPLANIDESVEGSVVPLEFSPLSTAPYLAADDGKLAILDFAGPQVQLEIHARDPVTGFYTPTQVSRLFGLSFPSMAHLAPGLFAIAYRNNVADEVVLSVEQY